MVSAFISFTKAESTFDRINNLMTTYQPIFSDLSPKVVDKFLDYHRLHPEVYELFKHFAYEARKRWDHFGAGALTERLRWEVDVQTHGQFKINNNFRSCFVRLLEFECPEFRGFFHKRHTPGTVC